MFGLDDHGNTTGIDRHLDCVGNLLGQSLLGLQAACVHIDNAGNLGQPQHLARRQVCDMALAYEGQQVVFA